jgi:tetratricopeptide (TPR) repeat protein
MTNKHIGIIVLLVLFTSMITTEAKQRTKEYCDQMLNQTEYGVRVLHEGTTDGRNYFVTWNCYREIGIEHPEYLEKGIQICEEEYNRTKGTLPARDLGEIYMSLAAIYNDASKYDTAIEWYLKSCEYERRIKYDCSLEYAKIALIYALKGDPENACKWCEESNKESPGFSNCATDFQSKWDYPNPTHCGYDTNSGSSRSGGSSSGFDVSSLLIPAGVLLVLAVLAAFFLARRRKQKKKP